MIRSRTVLWLDPNVASVFVRVSNIIHTVFCFSMSFSIRWILVVLQRFKKLLIIAIQSNMVINDKASRLIRLGKRKAGDMMSFALHTHTHSQIHYISDRWTIEKLFRLHNTQDNNRSPLINTFSTKNSSDSDCHSQCMYHMEQIQYSATVWHKSDYGNDACSLFSLR